MPTSTLDAWAQQTVSSAALSYFLMIGREVATLYLWGMAFFFIERLRPAEPQTPFFKRDFKTELCYPIFNAAFSTPIYTFLVLALTLGLLEPYTPHYILGAHVTTWPYWGQVLFALLVADAAVYIEHRFAHRVLWDFHSMHHMAKEVSWLTWARVHPVNVITIGLVAVIMRFIFGFASEAIVTAGWIGAALSVWEHSNLDFKLPKPLCYLVVTPHFHRWHHASEKEAIDKNFCLIFPFIDLIMGTYYCPDRKPHAYGVHRDRDPVTGELSPELPDTFLEQVVYPFKKQLERIPAFAKRTEAVPTSSTQTQRARGFAPGS